MTVETIHHNSNANGYGVESFAPVAGVAVAGIERIAVWAATVRTAAEAVDLIIDTPFVPAAFWPKFDPRSEAERTNARRIAVASATAAILFGDELGIGAMNSLSMVHVVKGKPGLYAEAMVALVRAAGHEVAVEDLTDTRCRVWGKRAGDDTVHRAEFGIERARKAGYVGQNAKYTSDPQAMLYARAVSILCRQMAPEVLRGLGSVEEAVDEPDGTTPRPATRTVQRAPQAPTAATLPIEQPPARRAPTAARTPSGPPPLPGEDDTHVVVVQATGEDGDAISDPQLRKLGAVFADLGITGTGSRERRLHVASTVVGRRLDSSKDLTRSEASTLIDTLEANGQAIVADLADDPDEDDDEDDDGLAPAELDPTLDPAWGGEDA